MRLNRRGSPRSAFCFLLVVLGVSLAMADEPPPAPSSDPCAAWTLNGYRVGMRFAEAEKLRPLKMIKGLTRLSSNQSWYKTRRPVDGKEGIVVFDREAHLLFWSLQLDEEKFSRLNIELRQRLGAPAREGVKNSEAGGMPNAAEESTIWRSPGCDAQITLAVYRAERSAGRVRALKLDRLSSTEEPQR